MAESQSITSAREYETIYVLRPDAGREASESISTRVQDVISKQRGALTRVENWGYRKLAYPVKKHGRGVYVYVKYLGDGELVSELERNLRLQDAVLKFQTVRLEDVASGAAAAPAEIEFEHLDVLEDAEPEDSVARALGLEGNNLRDDYHRSLDNVDADEPEEAGEEAEGTA
ncbi:MAG TPA: 30S ribosomal protein S6 [Polyangiaceae bacterium]|nr:30S ribosomal protein S6 [Polyangiaceae bacterium]